MSRRRIRLIFRLCFTGMLVLATIQLTITAMKRYEKTEFWVTKRPGGLFAQDSLGKQRFTFDTDLASSQIDPQAFAERDVRVNHIVKSLLGTRSRISRFKTDTIIHFVLPSRQGNEADLVLMGTLQAKLRSNLLSNESREVLQKELANLQSEIIGGIGIDRLTKEVRY